MVEYFHSKIQLKEFLIRREYLFMSNSIYYNMGRLKFGLFVPQGWRLDLPSDMDPRSQWKTIVRVAQRGEELGFDSIWIFDHFHTVPKPLKGRSVFEAWTTLTALAALTEKIRLGTLVTCILYRYPTVLAKILSNIDVISNGRIEFGVGACWYENEFKGYGIPFPRPGKRIRILDEALQIIKLMWTKDEVNFNGKYFKLESALNDPKPIQKPHPPILIGGAGEKLTLRVVAKHANKYHVWGNVEHYSKKLEVLKRHCDAVNRNFNEIVKVHDGIVLMGKNDEEIKKMLRKNEYFKLSNTSFESLRETQYVGTYEEIIEKIRRYSEIGVTEFIFYFPEAYKIKPIEEFAENVLPELKKIKSILQL